MSIRYKSSIAFVKDVPKSRRFYEEALGQETDFDMESFVMFKGGFGIWQEGQAREMIYGKDSMRQSDIEVRTWEFYFEADDLDKASRGVTNSGARFLHGISDTPWGQRTLRAYDPAGNIVEIAEPMPMVVKRLLDSGMSVEQVAEKTWMPTNEIREMLSHAH